MAVVGAIFLAFSKRGGQFEGIEAACDRLEHGSFFLVILFVHEATTWEGAGQRAAHAYLSELPTSQSLPIHACDLVKCQISPLFLQTAHPPVDQKLSIVPHGRTIKATLSLWASVLPKQPARLSEQQVPVVVQRDCLVFVLRPTTRLSLCRHARIA